LPWKNLIHIVQEAGLELGTLECQPRAFKQAVGHSRQGERSRGNFTLD